MKHRLIFRVARDVICALLVAGIVAAGALAWRLTQGPLAVNFLTPYLQDALNETLGDGNQLKIGDMALEWTTAHHRVEFIANNVDLTGAAQSAKIDKLGLNLSGLALLRGELRVGLLTLINPHFSFTLQPHKISLDQPAAPAAAQPDLLQRIANDPNLKDLRIIIIQNGQFDIIDPVQNETHSLANININFRRRLQGVKATVEATLKPADALDAFTLKASLQQDLLKGGLMKFSLSSFTPDSIANALKTIAPEAAQTWTLLGQIQLPLTITGELALTKNLQPVTLSAHVESDSGFITLPEIYAQGLPINSLAADVAYDVATGTVSWQNLAAEIMDPASTIHVTGNGQINTDQDNATHAQGSVTLKNMLVDQLVNYWPPTMATGGYKWVTANLHNGKIPAADVDFDLTDGAQGTVITKLDGTLHIDNTDVTFLDTFPPILHVSGTSTLNKDGMHFDMAGGVLNDVKMEPAKIDITGFNDTIQNIDITAPVTGQLPDVLHLINRPPYKYADRFGLDPNHASGGVGAKLHFKFPLLAALKMEEVDMNVIANIAQVSLPKFIAGRDVRRGVGVMELSGKGLKLTGAADLNALPLSNFVWQEDFTGKQPTTVTFDGIADTAEIASVGVPVTPYMTGDTKFSGTYRGGAEPTLGLNLDLRQTTVGMRELNWQKPLDMPMTAKVDLQFKTDGTTRLTNIQGNGPKIMLNGTGSLTKAGDIAALDLSRLVLGDKIDAAVSYDKSNGGQTWKIRGYRFDAAGLFTKDETGEPPAQKTLKDVPQKPRESRAINIGLGQLWLKDNMIVTNVGGDFIYNGQHWSRAVLDAQISKNNAVKILWGVNGNQTLSITATDIGPILKGFGITDSVEGGSLKITGAGDPANPNILTTGNITLSDFRVVRAPVLARLISLTSPMGLLDALRGEGLAFSKFVTDFTYDDSALTFDKGKLSGGSLGLTFEGNIDLTQTPEQLHLNGTVIPLNGINNALANIPIIGAIAGGADGGGILGANYKITGPADNPDVSVNPLSLLAPGFLRDLLF